MSLSPPEREAWRAVAALLGQLLLRELDAVDLASLRNAEVGRALDDLGLSLPAPGSDDAWLEGRGVEYHDLFLRPDSGGPLVQSLWTEGRYEGEAAVRVRQLARAAGVDFQRQAARGAPVDHLGSLLLLWAAADEESPEVAAELQRAHLDWALAPLGRIEVTGGFYGGVARAASGLLRQLCPAGVP